MPERNYYVICDDNCKFPSMTKEQILSAIEQAVEGGEIDVDAGIVSKIREINHNKNIRFWVGTQAEYNAVIKENDVFYIISDDQTKEQIIVALESLTDSVQGVSNAVNVASDNITNIQSDVSGIEGDTATMQQNLSSLLGEVNVLDDRLDTLEGDVDELNDLAEEIRSAGTLLCHQEDCVFATGVQNEFTLSKNYANYTRLIIAITLKIQSETDYITTNESCYPSIVGATFFMLSLFKPTGDIEPIKCCLSDNNKFTIASHYSGLNEEYFDIDILGIA